MEGRRLKKTLFLFTLTLSFLALGDDLNQLLMDQKGDVDLEKLEAKKGERPINLIDQGDPSLIEKISDDRSPFLSGKVEKQEIRSKGYSTDSDQYLPGHFEKSEKYIEYKSSEIVKEIYRKGSTTFHFAYMLDNYDYRDSSETYERTYESKDGNRYGSIHVSGGKRLFSSRVAYLGWELQGGLGLSQGKGIFVTGVTSDADFSLWTIPLDFLLTLEIPLMKIVHLEFNGGPSGVLLMQSRSDRESGDRDKMRRQLGYGYTAGGKVKFNISQISKKRGFKMYQDYNVSNFFINLEARIHDYGGFMESGVAVSGTSVGIGFSFEFL